MKNLSSRILTKLIEYISIPVWLLAWLKRHRTVRTVLIAAIVGSWAIIQLLGLQVYLGALMMVGRLAFVVIFILAQFIAMFAFLGSSKSIETVPGDKGQKSFANDYFGNDNEVRSEERRVGKSV